MAMPRAHQRLFVAILAAHLIVAATWIWRSSGVLHGERFFLLADDPMISMRYARNLADGFGLLWNPGQVPVEGFTNPLWVVVMAGVHLLHLPASKNGLVIQLLAVALLTWNLFLVRRLALRAGGDETTALGATLLTAFSYLVLAWGLSGWEVSLLMPIIAAAIVSAIDAVEQRRFPVVTYALLGGATFLRMDAAVVFLAVAATLVAYERRSRVQHALLAVLVLAAALGVQTAARFAYYGAPVPNTYYLKMTGYPVLWRAAWGLRYLAGNIWRQQPLLYVIVAVPLIARRLRTPGVVIAAAVVASQFLYSVYAGMMDNRFVTTVMPLVFVLFAIGLRTVVGELATAFQRVMHRRDVMFAVACGVAALMFGGGVSPWREAMVNPPTDEGLLERAEILERLTTPDASVAVVAAGTLPYLLRRPAIDLLGKNDSKVARADAHVEYRLFSTPFLSGHVKWDYGYSIGQLKPDVIADLWRDPDDARPYLDAYVPVTITEHRLFLRRGSPHVRWDRIAREPKVTIDAN